MNSDQVHAPAPSKPGLTGHDLGVLICRAFAIWVFILGYNSIVGPLIQDLIRHGYSGSALGFDGGATLFVLTLLMVVLYASVYVAIGLVLWRRAGVFADRMLGAPCDRVLATGFTLDTAMRGVLVGIGLWLGIPTLIHLVVLLIQFLYSMATFEGEGGIRGFFISDNPADGGKALLGNMLNPGAYLLGSLICIFCAGSITKFLLRVKSTGLNTDDNAA